MPVDAKIADRVRKACVYALAIALTLLTFRVLSRLANGHLSVAEPELWAALGLATVGFLWVRAARRAR